MKKILILFLILIINTGLKTYAESQKNTKAEQDAVLNCQKGDKILFYYETKDNQQHPERYLNAAKYFYHIAAMSDLSNPDSLVGQARISLHQNKLKEAKKTLFVALNYNELYPKTNFYLGETYFREGEFTQAIKYYKQAYTHGFAKDYKTNYQLGICYEKMNENTKARIHLQIASKLNPKSHDAQKLLDEMDNIKTNMKNFDKQYNPNYETDIEEEVTDEEIQNLQNIMH